MRSSAFRTASERGPMRVLGCRERARSKAAHVSGHRVLLGTRAQAALGFREALQNTGGCPSRAAELKMERVPKGSWFPSGAPNAVAVSSRLPSHVPNAVARGSWVSESGFRTPVLAPPAFPSPASEPGPGRLLRSKSSLSALLDAEAQTSCPTSLSCSNLCAPKI
jgi:hypothetical protein